MAAKGVWTLQEGMKKLEEKKKAEEEKNNRKRKVQKEPVVQASSSSQDDLERVESIKITNKNKKTRKAPARKATHSPTQSDSDSDLPLLPRETPPARKSPRIRDKAIVIPSSDSEPELLPLPTRTARKKICPSPQVRNLSPKLNGTPTNVKDIPPKVKDIPPKAKDTLTKEKDTSTKDKDTSTKTKKSVKRPLVEVQMSDSDSAPTRGRRTRSPRVPMVTTVIIQDPSSSRGKRVVKNAEVQAVEETARKRKAAPPAKPAGKAKAPKRTKGGPAKAGETPPLACGTIIDNERAKSAWSLDSVLGSGGFGYIYNTTNCKSKKTAVMKVEPQDNGPLFSEMHFYQRAGKQEFITGWCKKYKLKYLGIPVMLGSGIYCEGGKKIRYLIIPKYDNDVLKIFKSYNKKFSVDTTLQMCLRMIEALHYCHDAGYVHADIKSANMLTTNGDKEVHLADFGLARKYIVDSTHREYKEEPSKAHDGTKEYTSIDAHKGVPLSRRGDLHILCYCAIEWCGGVLPWRDWDNCIRIREEKLSWQDKMPGLVDKCFGKSAQHKGLRQFVDLCFKLGYKNKPDYTALIKVLKSGLSVNDTGYVTWS